MTKKLIDNDRLRVWFYPHIIGWRIMRKTFQPLGFVCHLGWFRLSMTLIQNERILFNPYTLECVSLDGKRKWIAGQKG